MHKMFPTLASALKLPKVDALATTPRGSASVFPFPGDLCVGCTRALQLRI
jgi:hypothetical protein